MSTTRAPDKKNEIKSDTKPASSNVAIIKHMNTFADNNGWIDSKSIAKACMEKLKLPKKVAEELGDNTMLVARIRGVKGVSGFFHIEGRFKAEDALEIGSDGYIKFMHPHDTGFYDQKTGDFKEAEFDAAMYDRAKHPAGTPLPKNKIIVDQDPTQPEVRIIFASTLKNFMKENCQDKVQSKWNKANFIFTAIGKAGNKGEFDMLTASSTVMIERLNSDKIMEACVRVEDLKSFYKDTNEFLNQRIQPNLAKK